MPQGLPRRIRYAFVTQGLLASLAVVIAVLVVTWLTREALVSQRLQVEAAAFWQAQGDTGALVAPLPKSVAVRSFYVPDGADSAGVREDLRSLPDGVTHLAERQQSVLVSRGTTGTLFIVLDTEPINRTLFGSALALILLGLLAAILISWLTYRRSRQIVRPINRLAEEVARWDPTQGDLTAPLAISGDSSREVIALSTALHGMAGRVAEFVQRERNFTRDASHELRTPLTVIRVASDMMLVDPAMPAHAQRSLQRIQRAGRELEAMIDAFLVLAREVGVAPISDEFDVLDVVREEVEKARPLLAGKPVDLRVVEHDQPRLYAPAGVFGVVVGHLLRNACNFTESGTVEVGVWSDAVVVADTGIGMSSETLQHAYDPFYRADAFAPLGKGFGLSIASRLARRFGWPLGLESAPGKGTTATLRFTPVTPD